MNESIDISLIIGILLTMAFSAFFSGTEIAFVSSNRMLFEVDKERHGLSTRLINFFYRHPNDFVSTMLVGNNVVLVIYGILIARFFDNSIFHGFTHNDEEFSKVDLDYLVQSSIDNAKSGDEIDDEVKIFQNALEFSETKVRDCMIPRTEINAVEYQCTVEELMQKFVESGNSKIIVYKDDIDHIEGYIHSSEMFKSAGKDWHQSIRTMPFVPETMAAQKLMKTFLQSKKSLGVVVDEFGGTSGIVSLEDIVEEIFGDIEDEHDSNKYVAKKINDNEYLLSARLEIDKVNDMFNLDLPEDDDYKTIGGYILNFYQSFPKLNEVIKIDHFSFKIIKSTMTKIELVKLTIL